LPKSIVILDLNHKKTYVSFTNQHMRDLSSALHYTVFLVSDPLDRWRMAIIESWTEQYNQSCSNEEIHNIASRKTVTAGMASLALTW